MASTQVQQSSDHLTTFEPFSAKGASEKHDVHTSLNYYKDPGDGSKPSPAEIGKPDSYQVPVDAVNVKVNDIRGQEGNFTLDRQGFRLCKHTSTEKDFLNDEKIKREHYPEVEQLLKDATGASRVFIFDHTIRRDPKEKDTSKLVLRGPVNRVHVDQSYSAAKSRVPYHLPEEAEKLLRTRYQIINVWRPIKTIYKDPLAVADASSVSDSDLEPVGLIFPDRHGETCTVRASPKHRWYYAYGQTPEEVMLFKCFDSKLDGRPRRVPHSAFVNPETVDAPSRESIEIRALVFHENESAE